MQRTHFFKTTHSSIRVLPCLHCRSEKGKLTKNSAVSMNWLHLRQTSSVRNTSDSGGPRFERVPGRSERGNLGQDLRRGRHSPSWIALGALPMITLPRSYLYKVQKEEGTDAWLREEALPLRPLISASSSLPVAQLHPPSMVPPPT